MNYTLRWVALARAEMKLGLPVTQKQVDELEAHIDDIDYKAAEEREKLVRLSINYSTFFLGLQQVIAAKAKSRTIYK